MGIIQSKIAGFRAFRELKKEENKAVEELLKQDKNNVIVFYYGASKSVIPPIQVIVASENDIRIDFHDKGGRHTELERQMVPEVEVEEDVRFHDTLAKNGYLVIEMTGQGISCIFLPDILSEFQLQVLSDYCECLKKYNEFPYTKISNITYVKDPITFEDETDIDKVIEELKSNNKIK